MQECDNLSKFGLQFQKKCTRVLCKDVIFLSEIRDLIDVDYFEMPSHKWIVEKTMSFYKLYKNIPSLDYFKIELDSTVSSNEEKTSIIEDLRFIYVEPADTDTAYIKEEFQKFCKNQLWKLAILNSIDDLKHGDYDKIKQRVTHAQRAGETDSDYTMDYILEAEDRYNSPPRDTLSTGYELIDELMDGGLGIGELAFVAANAGKGKSWILCDIGLAALKQNKRVLHYSLELTKNYVGYRYDCLLTHIPVRDLIRDKDKVITHVRKLNGSLKVKYYPDITIQILRDDILREIDDGNHPDLVVIDYADIIGVPNYKSSDSTYITQGDIYKSLRSMGHEFKTRIWSASQANRDGEQQEELSNSNLSDSYKKVQIADFAFSFVRSNKHKLAKTAFCQILKNRFGPDGLSLPMKFDTDFGYIDFFEPSSKEAMEVRESIMAVQKQMDSSFKNKVSNHFKPVNILKK